MLADAFKALGFDPETLGGDREGKQAKPKKQPKKRSEERGGEGSRAKTSGEKAADGLGPESPGYRSPDAHPDGSKHGLAASRAWRSAGRRRGPRHHSLSSCARRLGGHVAIALA